ncbi:acyltransferase [Solibacillus sp. FSL W8-0474]|uniref:acyltransferase family protein n=1 Tax=Solibacillus sp. FSL W8-0474 TaxID=2975336 RepID=UPI0030F9A897
MGSTESKDRLTELDALRGLAALAVVIFHYTTRYNELFGHEKSSYLNFTFGHMGVNLFFMISGFVIFMTLRRINNVKEFAIKRAFRLYPA